MSRPDDPREGVLSPDECEAGELLANALEGNDAPGVDGEALRVACLLQALAPGRDEVAQRRLRTRLVGAASRRRRRPALRLVVAAAAAAALLFSTCLLLRVWTQPSQQLLAERESQASLAVARVSSGWSDEAAVSSRISTLFQRQWRDRLDAKVQSERSELLKAQLSGAAANGTSTAPAQVGGTS